VAICIVGSTIALSTSPTGPHPCPFFSIPDTMPEEEDTLEDLYVDTHKSASPKCIDSDIEILAIEILLIKV
jgi:hypothetical protein